MDLHFIYQILKKHEKTLEAYFQREFQKTPPLIYLSCDLRNSGHKVSVVDTNLFPAGFNNLCNSFSRQAIEGFRKYLHQYFPRVQKILLFSEAHTRNRFYFENILHLSSLITQAGYEVKVATQSADFPEDPTLIYLGEKQLALYQLRKEGTQVFLREGWQPDLILSNNDFSNGVEPVLQEIETPILPPARLGWHRRRKSDHFRHTQQIVSDLGEQIGLDPWLISCISASESDIDFNDTASMERLAKTVDRVLAAVKQKYDEYQIPSPPYVFIKSNSGTYGMAVTYVASGQEVLSMNRKMRSKMLAGKGGTKVSDYLIQEGISTADSYSGYPMEPVIYGIGEDPIGGFFRLNEEKDNFSSLNTKGMAFSCLCLHKLDQPHEAPFLRCTEKSTLLAISFTLTKIATLAAAREAQEG